jgi:hypothetical protein
MTELGKICRERAITQLERRFLGSKHDTCLDDGPDAHHILINERVLAATLLEIRTAKCPRLSVEQRAAAKVVLGARYVTFFFLIQERTRLK